MFLPNYSSGNIKTNSIQPVLARLAFFEAIWHFFASGLAYFIHLDLATLFVVNHTFTTQRHCWDQHFALLTEVSTLCETMIEAFSLYVSVT